jgi:RNA polymerase sigma factor (sigma-70 family)
MSVAVGLPELDETWDMLRRLPDRQRIALVLRFYEDLPEREIADLLGCRPGTVKSLIHRGLARVRKETGR